MKSRIPVMIAITPTEAEVVKAEMATWINGFMEND